MSINAIRKIYARVPKSMRAIAYFRRMPVWMMMADEKALEKLIRTPGVGVMNKYKILQRLIEMKTTERLNDQMADMRTSYENRWEEEAEMDYPSPPKFSTRCKIILLPDGRRAERIGEDLARPLCGLREVVRISTISRRLYDRRYGKCRSCGGLHVSISSYPSYLSSPSSHHSHSESDHLRCPRCKGQGLELEEALRAIHCLSCGWYGFVMVSRLSDEEIAKNEEVLAEAPARYTIEEEMEEGGMEEEEEVEVDEENEVEDRLDQLIHGLSRLWMERSLRSIRNQLIEKSVTGIRPLLWAAVISFIEEGNTAVDLVPFLSILEDQDLADYAGFEDEDEEREFGFLVERKLDQWKKGVRSRIARFRSKEAGIRIIGRKLHPSADVLRAVVGE